MGKPFRRDIPTPRSSEIEPDRVSLDSVIGNSPFHGGARERITLRQWLGACNRTPQYRARQLALRLIEQQARDLSEFHVVAARTQNTPDSQRGGA